MDEFTVEFVEMFKRWSDFEGKSNLKEYWMPVLVHIIVGVLFGALGRVAGIFNTLYAVYGLVIIVPFLALAIRRMHDIGKSGWMYLIVFIPLIGAIWILVLLLKDSEEGDNKYGPNPKL